MSANPALPLVTVALVAAASRHAGGARAAPHSSKTPKITRGRMLIRGWPHYLASRWRQYLAWQARRGMRMLLHALDDRTLRDIGLTRSEIDTAVRAMRLPRRQWPE